MKSLFLLLVIGLYGCFAAEPQSATSIPSPVRDPKGKVSNGASQSPAARLSSPKSADANQPQAKAFTDRQKPKEQPVVQPPVVPPIIVAKIGDYVVTRQELEHKLMMELRPYEYEQYNIIAALPDAKTVLVKIIAEKAMVMEGRRQNFLEDPEIRGVVRQFKDRNLANLLLQKHLQSKLIITESEVEEKMKADPKLDHAQAKAMLERVKANKLLDQYYSDIYAKFHVKKLSDNFDKAAKIHERLLHYPKTPRDVGFIRNKQIDTDLTPEEKDMVLATYDGGKLILKNWFSALCEMAPPRRPTNLNTPAGVEQLLDVALRIPLFVSEAELLGLDKDENFLKQVKEWEDLHLLNKVRTEKVKDINEPTPEQIIDYFNKNKEVFITDRTLKIDQIWCQDLKTTHKAKAELDGGKDFESVRGLYSLEKKGAPLNTYPATEGIFFNDLWKGEPNQLIAPVKGFYGEIVKWRIVKILEKNPGKAAEYSDDMRDRIKRKMVSERGNALLENYGKELLEKYKYEIYADRIKDIEPLNIP